MPHSAVPLRKGDSHGGLPGGERDAENRGLGLNKRPRAVDEDEALDVVVGEGGGVAAAREGDLEQSPLWITTTTLLWLLHFYLVNHGGAVEEDLREGVVHGAALDDVHGVVEDRILEVVPSGVGEGDAAEGRHNAALGVYLHDVNIFLSLVGEINFFRSHLKIVSKLLQLSKHFSKF